MATADFEVDVDGGTEMLRAAKALGDAHRDIGRRMDDIVWDGAVDVANEAAKVVQTIPTKGRKHTGLRKRIASGIDVRRLSTGKVRVQTSMLDHDEAIIPRGFDSPLKGFWHPVFGDRDPEDRVTQRPGVPYRWFRDTMPKALDIIRDDLEDMLDDEAEDIRNATIL